MASSSLKQPDNSRFMELALEGQNKLLHAPTSKSGIGNLEEARVLAMGEGMGDSHALSAIYSQLGNAYFTLRNYNKALEYHEIELAIARKRGDVTGEIKANGNMGVTLTRLGKFDEAYSCCKLQLNLAQSLGDKTREAWALYNLGNLYSAKGAQDSLPMNPSIFTAIHHYEANLKLVEEQEDKSAIFRVCVNLGNMYFLLEQFNKAIAVRNKLLTLVKESGDKPAMSRVLSKLGNAHARLGEVNRALDYYRRALAIAVELEDQAAEAQLCYSLSHTSNLAGEHQQALDYQSRHLLIVRQLQNSMDFAQTVSDMDSASDNPMTISFDAQGQTLSNETSESIADQTLIADLQSEGVSVANADVSTESWVEITPGDIPNDFKTTSIEVESSRQRQLEHLLSETATIGAETDGEEMDVDSCTTPSGNVPVHSNFPEKLDRALEQESFFDMLSRMQGKRIDDQRCNAPNLADSNKENKLTQHLPETVKQRRRLSLGIGNVLVDLTFRRRAKPGKTLDAVDETSASVCSTESRSSASRRRSLGVFQPKFFSTPSVPPKRNYIQKNETVSLSATAGSLPPVDPIGEDLDIASAQDRSVIDQPMQLASRDGRQQPELMFNKGKEREGASTVVEQTSALLPVFKIETSAHLVADDSNEALAGCQKTLIEEPCSELPSVVFAPLATAEDDILSVALEMQ